MFPMSKKKIAPEKLNWQGNLFKCIIIDVKAITIEERLNKTPLKKKTREFLSARVS